MASIEQLKGAYVTVLGIDGASIDWDHLEYRSIPEWDSAAHMELIAEVEDVFDVMLDTVDVIGLSSFSEAIRILAKYGVDLDGWTSVSSVTGSTRGIGWATARVLAAAGCTIVLNGTSDEARLEARVDELQRITGAWVHGRQFDVADDAAVTTCFGWIRSSSVASTSSSPTPASRSMHSSA